MTHPQIAALPLAEKIELMESLWDAICHEPAATAAIPDWHQGVLAERIVRLDSGEEPVSSWDEAKQRIRDQAGKPCRYKPALIVKRLRQSCSLTAYAFRNLLPTKEKQDASH